MDTAVLWLWLAVLPAAIGLSAETWLGCVGLGLVYVLLFDLDTAIASIGSLPLADVSAPLVADDLMIVAVAVACHGLRRAFRGAD